MWRGRRRTESLGVVPLLLLGCVVVVVVVVLVRLAMLRRKMR